MKIRLLLWFGAEHCRALNANEDWTFVVIGCRTWPSFGYDWVPMKIGHWGKLYWECKRKWAFWIPMRIGLLFFFFTFFFVDENGSWNFVCQWRLSFGLERKLGVPMEIGLYEFQWELNLVCIVGALMNILFWMPIEIGPFFCDGDLGFEC